MVEQSVGSGFSMPGGLPLLCFVDPAKPKKSRRGWGCCLCPKLCRRSGWKMCPSMQTLHDVPSRVAGKREVPTAALSQRCQQGLPLPLACVSPQSVEVRHLNVILLPLLPLSFCVCLCCAFFVRK